MQEAPKGSRNGPVRELVGYSFAIDPRFPVLRNPRRHFCTPYAAAETLWYLSRQRNVEMLLSYAPQYKRFADEYGNAHGAYGYRWENHKQDQIKAAIELLKRSEETRQCVIAIWNATDLCMAAYDFAEPDMPCTLTIQFLVNSGQLHMIVNMRSNDLWLGTPYDVFAFTSIQQLVAGELALPMGTYVHQVGSMHLYESNYHAAAEACSPGLVKVEAHEYADPQRMDLLRDALLCERRMRVDAKREPMTRAVKYNDLLRDLVCACGWKTTGKDIPVQSLALAASLRDWRKYDNRRRD